MQQSRQLPSRHTVRRQEGYALHATSGDSQSSNDTLEHEEKVSSRMARTLGNLDALLGVEEEKKEESEQKTTDTQVTFLYKFCIISVAASLLSLLFLPLVGTALAAVFKVVIPWCSLQEAVSPYADAPDRYRNIP